MNNGTKEIKCWYIFNKAAIPGDFEEPLAYLSVLERNGESKEIAEWDQEKTPITNGDLMECVSINQRYGLKVGIILGTIGSLSLVAIGLGIKLIIAKIKKKRS